MGIRQRLRDEIAACLADEARPAWMLAVLIDEHASMPRFDPIWDGELENDAIRVLSARQWPVTPSPNPD